MDKVLDKIFSMKQNQWMMLAGFVFIAMGGGVSWGGFAVNEGMGYSVMGAGALCVMTGAVMAIIRANAEAKDERDRRDRDAEIRIAKLNAGMDPADDKTIFARSPTIIPDEKDS